MASSDTVEGWLDDENETSLKPCPFCGGKAEFFTIEKGRDKGAHFIQCTNPACEASTNLQWSLKEDARPMLAERWNERAGTTAKTDALQSLLKEVADDAEIHRLKGDGWRSVETAPKGVKLIAGYTNELGKWRTILARYYLADTLEMDWEMGGDVNGFAPAGWYEETEEGEWVNACQTPTHWMPLPEPPRS